MKSNTVSVIISTYNRTEMLERAVHSALEQTHEVHEILVCDDGSTDGTQDRIAAIGDHRVVLIGGAHAGRPAIPRNRGIARASGEWLAFMDDDDTWIPSKLATQFRAMQSLGTDAASSNALRVSLDGDDLGPYFQDEADSRLRLEQLLVDNKVICSSVLARRHRVLQVGGFPEAPHLRALEDYGLWLRLALGTDFAYCAEPLVRYTDSPATSLRRDSRPPEVERAEVLEDLWAWGKSSHFTSAQRRVIARALRGARRTSGQRLRTWVLLR